MSYCDIAPGHPVHGPYHDEVYGFPVTDDDALFERLVLEINQAGLSWLTILKKQEAFRRAFDHFEIAKVARYGSAKRERLLRDEGIIRNRLKVNAAIENAKRLEDIGSFAGWLDSNHPRQPGEWVKLFKKTFVFTGGEITTSFLLSVGYLEGAHDRTCPVFARVAKAKPAWMRKGKPG